MWIFDDAVVEEATPCKRTPVYRCSYNWCTYTGAVMQMNIRTATIFQKSGTKEPGAALYTALNHRILDSVIGCLAP